jgi:uncharacterized protein (TIGR02246 family)
MNPMLLVVVLVATVAAYPQALSQSSPDEAAIHRIIQDEIRAWNAGDASAFARHFASGGTFTNIRGQFFTGQMDFIERHDFIFKGIYRGTTMKQDFVSLKFVRPEVAVVETLTAVLGIQKPMPGMSVNEKGMLRSRLLQVMVKNSGEWQVVTFHNTDVRTDVPVPDPK